MPKNSGNFGANNKAAVSHGMYSLRDSGPSRLTAEQITRLAELRQMVRDNPGRQELRQELTARTALICELGFAHLRREHEAGQDIWSSHVIRRLGTYIAETRRLLDSFKEEKPGFFAEQQRINKILENDPNRSD